MERENRFDGLKRRFFLVTLPITSIATFADWLMHRMNQTPARFAALPTILIPLLLALLLWRKRRSLRFVEAAALTWVTAGLLSQFYAILFTDQANRLEQVISFAPWFSVCLAAIFLVFGPKRATWIAAGVYLIALALGVTHLVMERLGGQIPLLVRPLMHLYLANAAFVTFLFYYASVREQVDRSHSLAKSMTDLANTDPLLGIPNRRHIYATIRDEITLAQEGMKPSVLIMFDLDRFKEVNDTYGHEAGDHVLQTVSSAVQQTLRASDRFGRWGGDEFIVLVGVADLTQANLLAQRLREAVNQRLSERFWRVTVSVGVAPLHRGDSVESWVKRADQALYRAKESGRNRVVVGS